MVYERQMNGERTAGELIRMMFIWRSSDVHLAFIVLVIYISFWGDVFK